MPEMNTNPGLPRRPAPYLLIGTAGLVALLGARASWAAGGEQCATAYERAQELRRAGSLVDARAQLLTCASASCPAFITADCRRWLDEVEAALPSVVFAARKAGRDLEQVLVEVDDQLVAERLDGRAVAIDPGKHTFTFTAPGAAPARIDAIINEGSKHRLIAVDIAASQLPTPAQVAAPALPPVDAPTQAVGAATDLDRRPAPPSMRPLPRALFVVSALGLAGFAGLGLWGLHDERGLRDECAPGCAPARVDRVHRQYLAADISLAAGVVALGLGVYFHSRSPATEASPRFALGLVDGGGTLGFGERF
jgi:hypothetical protein